MYRRKLPKEQWTWAFYDWANSVYSLVIGTAIFPIYYASVTSAGDGAVQFLGRTFANSEIYSYSLSLSFLLVAIVSPILSGIADSTGSKKKFLQFFCYLGALSSTALYFFTSENQVIAALALSILASIGFWGSIVFYNSYLPEIAPPEQHDELSARGYSLGYLGSSLLLIINLITITYPETFGFKNAAHATRFSFLTVGIWWAGFAQITFKYLPKTHRTNRFRRGYLVSGYIRIRQVFKQIMRMPYVKLYLFSFFLFSVGVQTIILIATLFGSQELKLESNQLILTILLIQFFGIAGAQLFAFISSKVGNIRALMVNVSIWITVSTMAYFLDANDAYVMYKFFALGSTVGLIMGGIQSLARSTYSKMIPPTENTVSFFSFYDITEKIAIVVGTFLYGAIIGITGSMKSSALMLAVFFLLAIIFLSGVKMREVRKKKASRYI
ncbi:MFS transporter [Schleiferia thermophila]|uniref:MFS transporter n=1 Tax=Schleiferia thermophila TaxID=884107 RepID=UPI003EEEDA5D